MIAAAISLDLITVTSFGTTNSCITNSMITLFSNDVFECVSIRFGNNLINVTVPELRKKYFYDDPNFPQEIATFVMGFLK